MSLMTKEQLRLFIKENNIQSVSELYSSLKNLFQDALQELLEAELSAELGYDKYDKKNNEYILISQNIFITLQTAFAL